MPPRALVIAYGWSRLACLTLEGLARLHAFDLLQSLGLTMGVAGKTWVVLDTLRKKRNQSDYSGDLIEPGAVPNLHPASAVAARTYARLAEAASA